MRRLLIASVLLAGFAAYPGPALADDADDLGEIVRLQTRLRAEVPADLRVFSAEFGSGVTLLLRRPKSAPLQAWIESGSDWVELKPSGYVGLSCQGKGIAIGEFSLEAGMRAYFKARAIAQEMGANAIEAGAVRFSLEGIGCEPGWRTTLNVKRTRYVYPTFDTEGRLVRVTQWEDGNESALDPASLRALDLRASAALPTLRAEAEALPAEAAMVQPSGEEYLVASIAGQPYQCAADDIHFLYDYYRIELRCEGEQTADPLMVQVANVSPGKSQHTMVAGMAGPALWMRRGMVQLESDDAPGDTWVWIDALDTKLIEGRFEGTLTNASGKRVRVADGRFRLLPGAGFRVSRP